MVINCISVSKLVILILMISEVQVSSETSVESTSTLIVETFSSSRAESTSTEILTNQVTSSEESAPSFLVSSSIESTSNIIELTTSSIAAEEETIYLGSTNLSSSPSLDTPIFLTQTQSLTSSSTFTLSDNAMFVTSLPTSSLMSAFLSSDELSETLAISVPSSSLSLSSSDMTIQTIESSSVAFLSSTSDVSSTMFSPSSEIQTSLPLTESPEDSSSSSALEVTTSSQFPTSPLILTSSSVELSETPSFSLPITFSSSSSDLNVESSSVVFLTSTSDVSSTMVPPSSEIQTSLPLTETSSPEDSSSSSVLEVTTSSQFPTSPLILTSSSVELSETPSFSLPITFSSLSSSDLNVESSSIVFLSSTSDVSSTMFPPSSEIQTSLPLTETSSPEDSSSSSVLEVTTSSQFPTSPLILTSSVELSETPSFSLPITFSSLSSSDLNLESSSVVFLTSTSDVSSTMFPPSPEIQTSLPLLETSSPEDSSSSSVLEVTTSSQFPTSPLILTSSSVELSETPSFSLPITFSSSSSDLNVESSSVVFLSSTSDVSSTMFPPSSESQTSLPLTETSSPEDSSSSSVLEVTTSSQFLSSLLILTSTSEPIQTPSFSSSLIQTSSSEPLDMLPFSIQSSSSLSSLSFVSPSPTPSSLGPVSNLSIIEVQSTLIKVAWDPPLTTNGVITSYIIKYFTMNNLVDTLILNYTNFTDQLCQALAGLLPNTLYTISVSAVTLMEGPSTNITELTLKEVLPFISSTSGSLISAKEGSPFAISFFILPLTFEVSPSDIEWRYFAQPGSNDSYIIVLEDERRTFSEDRLTLNIDSARVTDIGIFGIFLNKEFNSSSNSQVTVRITEFIPQITVGLENQTTETGGNFTLTCSALADPNPTFTWRFQGNKISASEKHVIVSSRTQSSLTVNNVVIGDDGLYSCSASNRFGSNSTASTVTVQSSRDAVLLLNFSQTFRPWGSSSLTLDAQKSQRINHPRDKFDAVRRNPYFIISQAVAPEFLFRSTTNRSIVIGETLTLACRALANPIAKVTWLRNSVSEMSLGAFITMVTVGMEVISTLSFSNFTEMDSGTYSCLAMNDFGSIREDFQIDIAIRPAITNITVNSQDFEGVLQHESTLTRIDSTSLTVQCFATGNAEVVMQWLEDGIALVNSTGIRILPTEKEQIGETFDYMSVLNFSNLQPSDGSSHYSCQATAGIIAPISGENIWVFGLIVEAENDCQPNPCQNNGTCLDGVGNFLCNCQEQFMGQTCTERVQENESPSIVTSPVSRTAKLYESVILSCEAAGSPPPIIQWYKDDESLDFIGGEYTIASIKPTDRGQYHCTASSSGFQTATSAKALVLIEGLLQFTFALNVSENAQGQFSEDFITQINSLLSVSDPQLLINIENITDARIVSVQQPPLSNESGLLLVTVDTKSSGLSTSALSSNLFLSVEAKILEASEILNVEYSISSMARYDGCATEEEMCGNVGLIKWPETDIYSTAEQSCPCGISADLLSDLNLIATRTCGGNYLEGGKWSDPLCELCNFKGTTKSLCGLANVDSGAQLVNELVDITGNTEEIATEDVSLTVVLLTSIDVANEVKEDSTVANGIFNTVGQLSSTSADAIRDSQETTRSSSKMLDLVQNVAEVVPVSADNPYTFVSPVLGVRVEEVDSRTVNENFVPNLDSLIKTDNTTQNMSSSLMAILPSEIFSNTNSSRRVSATLFQNDALFLPSSNFSETNSQFTRFSSVGSDIIGLSIAGSETIENLNNPVTIIFDKTKVGQFSRCQFWNFSLDDGLGGWDSFGCELVNETSSTITCQCNHLTNFAILLDIFPQDAPPTLTIDPPLEDQILTAVSYIGSIVSIICLVITIITYVGGRHLRKEVHKKLMINLCIALTGLYATFIISTFSMGVWQWCIVVSAMLQYFFLATFFWMAADAIHLFRKLVQVFKPDFKNYVGIAIAVCWVVPAFIVAFSLAPKYDNYFNPNYCRVDGYSFYFGVLLPFGLIYLFNWLVFIVIFTSLSSRPNMTKEVGRGKSSHRKLKESLWVAIGLSLLFGLGWGIGLLASSRLPSYLRILFEWLFTLLTAFQGLVIFAIYCLRAADVRTFWMRVLCCQKRKQRWSTRSTDTERWTDTFTRPFKSLSRTWSRARSVKSPSSTEPYQETHFSNPSAIHDDASDSKRYSTTESLTEDSQHEITTASRSQEPMAIIEEVPTAD